jgi:ribose transport system substrate-binding protein
MGSRRSSSSFSLRKTARYRWLGALSLAVVAIAVAACGSSGSSSSNASTSAGAASTTSGSASSGVAKAQAALKVDEAPSKWVAPGPSLTVSPKVKGKTIAYIANGLALPFTQSLVGGVKDAAQTVGMKVTVTDGAGQAAQFARLIQQAIGAKAAVIVIQSEPFSALVAPIKAAKQAGIPVILDTDGDPALPTSEEAAAGVVATTSFCYSCVGTSIANFIVATSKGDANVGEVNVPDVGPDKAYTDQFKADLNSLCPDCKLKTVGEPLAQWTTGLPSLTSSLLKSDPNINYLFPHYDGMVALMKPSVLALGRGSTVKIVSYNADLPNMQAIAKPDDPEWADVGGSEHWLGWATVDQVIRLLGGEKPLESENVPNRTFDKTNIGQIDLTANESTWYGVDFATEYKKLWGLQ